MILPKFSQKLADFRPDFCRFCRFLLPRQTAKALYTFAAAIATASGMYSNYQGKLDEKGAQYMGCCRVSNSVVTF